MTDDPRAICRCGRLMLVRGVEVRPEGMTWDCFCQHCGAACEVLAWPRPHVARSAYPAAAVTLERLRVVERVTVCHTDTRNRSIL